MEQNQNNISTEELLKNPAELTKILEEYITYEAYDLAIMHAKRKLIDGILVMVPEYIDYLEILIKKAISSPDEETCKEVLQKIYSNWEHHKRYSMPWPVKRENPEVIYDKRTMCEILKAEKQSISKGKLQFIIKQLENKERDAKKVETRLTKVMAKVSYVKSVLDEVISKCRKVEKLKGEKLQNLVKELEQTIIELKGVEHCSDAEV